MEINKSECVIVMAGLMKRNDMLTTLVGTLKKELQEREVKLEEVKQEMRELDVVFKKFNEKYNQLIKAELKESELHNDTQDGDT